MAAVVEEVELRYILVFLGNISWAVTGEAVGLGGAEDPAVVPGILRQVTGAMAASEAEPDLAPTMTLEMLAYLEVKASRLLEILTSLRITLSLAVAVELSVALSPISEEPWACRIARLTAISSQEVALMERTAPTQGQQSIPIKVH